MRKNPPGGFTLIELLVAMAILTLILGFVFSLTNMAGKSLQYSSAKIEAFASARSAFDLMTRTIGSATLNTYYDYYNSSRQRLTPANASSFVPALYGRYSELEFVCGKNLVQLPRKQVTHSIFFQTPLSYTQIASSSGLSSLLNAVGFYIEFNNDSAERPPFFNPTTSRWRYRLMQLVQPTEKLSIYKDISAPSHAWFTDAISATPQPARVLAENIIACVICPRMAEDGTTVSSLTTNYEYDSNIALAAPSISWTSGSQPVSMNQLPPTVRVVLIALDERSMTRLQGSSSMPPDLGFNYNNVFQTSANLEADLATVSAALTAKKLNFRIFQTDVAIRGAKWSP